MRIISKKRIVEYHAKHPDSKTALEEWTKKTEKAKWENFADIKTRSIALIA